MVDVDVNKVKNIDPLRISEVRNIDPVTIAKVEKIAPAAVHIKELNHIDPLSIESLRVDRVRNIEPVAIDKLNVTHIPTVNLSVSRVPTVDLNLRKIPPVAIAVQQCFDLPSHYTIHTRLLGFEVARLEVHGQTRVVPRDRYRREQAHTPQQSFPDVAPLGHAGIPVKVSETTSVVRPPPVCHSPPRALHAGAPRNGFSVAGGSVGSGS